MLCGVIFHTLELAGIGTIWQRSKGFEQVQALLTASYVFLNTGFGKLLLVSFICTKIIVIIMGCKIVIRSN